jgi:nitrogenase molybdenum-iron protein alpha/beta subunit
MVYSIEETQQLERYIDASVQIPLIKQIIFVIGITYTSMMLRLSDISFKRYRMYKYIVI